MSESFISTVKRLAELEPIQWAASPRFTDESGDWIVHGANRNRQPKIAICKKEDAIYIADRLNAAPKLLEVLRHFEPNDAYLLDALICMIDRDHMHEFAPHRAALVRMCHAAAKMEATE